MKTTRTARLVLAAIGATGALLVAGCGSSDSGGSSSGGSSGSGASGGSGGTAGAGATGGASGSAGTGSDSGPCVQGPAAEAECKQQGAGTCAAVLDCACANCACELGLCQADPGCIAIRECAQQKGCTGADCLTPCADVIGAHPDSVTPALAVSNCVEQNKCPVTCDDGGTDAATD